MTVDKVVSEWRFGRVVRILVPLLGCFALVFVIYATLLMKPPWPVYFFVVAPIALLCVMTLILWTSELRIANGTLTATDLFRTRTVALRNVQSVTCDGWLGGLVITRRDGTRIRSLMSFGQGAEPWNRRWFRITDEVNQRISLG